MRHWPGILAVSAALSVSCAHSVIGSVAGRPGVENGVMPVYVHATGQETERESRDIHGKKLTITSIYQVCTGVYVRPHVLVTVAAVFPGEFDGNSVQYLGDINVGDDGARRTVTGYVVHDLVAVIRTEEEGRPLPLRPGQAAVGENLTVMGFGFTASLSAQLHAVPEWRVRPAVITDSPLADLGGGDDPMIYRARTTEQDPGQCGAPLIDGAGRLVGIVNLGLPQRREVSVINAAMIAAALREAGL